MRKSLSKNEGERKKFIATFSRTGKKTNYQGYSDDTILLTGVKDAETGEVLTDHVWFAYTKTFEKLRLQPGMVVLFEARVRQYKKGYVNRALGINKRSFDFKLSHPTKVAELKS